MQIFISEVCVSNCSPSHESVPRSSSEFQKVWWTLP